MQEWLLKALLPTVIALLLKTMTAEKLKGYADQILDVVENAVKDSETSIDDLVVLPVINSIRATFDIPDND